MISTGTSQQERAKKQHQMRETNKGRDQLSCASKQQGNLPEAGDIRIYVGSEEHTIEPETTGNHYPLLTRSRLPI